MTRFILCGRLSGGADSPCCGRCEKIQGDMSGDLEAKMSDAGQGCCVNFKKTEVIHDGDTRGIA